MSARGRPLLGRPLFFLYEDHLNSIEKRASRERCPFSVTLLVRNTWNLPVAVCNEIFFWVVVHVCEVVASFAQLL